MGRIELLIQEASEFSPVPLQASTAYYNQLKEMTACVDEALSAHSEIHELIGNNPLQVMYDNHRHHGAFMATVFSIGNYSLLARTLPWVYRAYHAHNFSYEYFRLELKTWLLVAEKRLEEVDVAAIRPVYQWMIDRHQVIIDLSREEDPSQIPVDVAWLERKTEFFEAILRNDHKACLRLAASAVETSKDIEGFYLNVLQPTLYEIGMLWEKAEISVVQEHLASAIISRVMATVNLIDRPLLPSIGKVVVAASPNEFHEIGASMIADTLEHDGWEVAYLGGNVPKEDLLAYLHDYRPQLLALSVTIAFNVDHVRDVIAAIHNNEALKQIKVMVGGRVFNDNEGLWRMIGADGFAENLCNARSLAFKWRGLGG